MIDGAVRLWLLTLPVDVSVGNRFQPTEETALFDHDKRARVRRRAALTMTAGAVALGVVATPSAVGAAVNYFDVTSTVSGYGSASCPSGWKVTGGGFEVPSDYFGSSSSEEYSVSASYPTANGWRGRATKVSGSYSSTYGWKFRTGSYTPTVYAICTR